MLGWLQLSRGKGRLQGAAAPHRLHSPVGGCAMVLAAATILLRLGLQEVHVDKVLQHLAGAHAPELSLRSYDGRLRADGLQAQQGPLGRGPGVGSGIAQPLCCCAVELVAARRLPPRRLRRHGASLHHQAGGPVQAVARSLLLPITALRPHPTAARRAVRACCRCRAHGAAAALRIQSARARRLCAGARQSSVDACRHRECWSHRVLHHAAGTRNVYVTASAPFVPRMSLRCARVTLPWH